MARDPLSTYRGKRDFARTPEPAGSSIAAGRAQLPAAGGAPRFVVQRHRARRTHYDFRLEINGVLASWAVPKGPTLDPNVRRAAFHVEDHPIEYFDFEGVIPAGEYGGGDVIVWDVGTWDPHKAGDPVDPGRAVRDGELHMEMHGAKLRGRFVLVRTRTDDAGKEEWLLLHKHDEWAQVGWDPDDYPRSALSGRTNEEVKADPDKLWRSDLPAARAAVVLKAPADAPTEAEIAALDEMTRDGPWHVFGRELRITNLDKVMFDPRGGEPAVTKRDLVRYAAQIAPTVLPYLRHRAVIMHRYPGGAAGRGIWQRELPEHAPQWLPRWDNPEADSGEPHTYLVVDEPAALVWAANFGAVEWHAWTSLVDAPHQPTYALVDLDPASDPASDPGKSMDWSDLLVLARLYRTAVEHLGLTAGVKVTGRRGIQIWIPVARGPGFDETRAWVEQLSKSIGAVVPELVSRQVGDRAGRARLDYTRNAIDRTLVAPYSPRAAAGAPVSAPITWQELDDPALQPDRWTVRTIGERIAAAGDPFRDLENSAQRLPVLR